MCIYFILLLICYVDSINSWIRSVMIVVWRCLPFALMEYQIEGAAPPDYNDWSLEGYTYSMYVWWGPAPFCLLEKQAKRGRVPRPREGYTYLVHQLISNVNSTVVLFLSDVILCEPSTYMYIHVYISTMYVCIIHVRGPISLYRL